MYRRQTLTYIYRRLDLEADFDVYMQILTYIYIYANLDTCIHADFDIYIPQTDFDVYIPQTMGWLQLVGSIKLLVSFAKETYKRDNILQKRPII